MPFAAAAGSGESAHRSARRRRLRNRGDGGESEGCLTSRCRTADFGDASARKAAMQNYVYFVDALGEEFRSLSDLERKRGSVRFARVVSIWWRITALRA
jgi:hypothetical protein